MKRIFTITLSTIAVASIAAPVAALEDRHATEFYEGLGNKLTDQTEQEVYGTKLTERFEEEFYEGLGNH